MNEQKTTGTAGALENVKNDVELKRITFQQLAQGASEVLVEHDGQLYRLRLTRNGKLILNK